VYGSVAPELCALLAWDAGEEGGVVELVAEDAGGAELEDVVVEPALELELPCGGAGAVADDVEVVGASGSTYCWSPAEVPVPWASADSAASPPPHASAALPIRIARSRLTSEALNQGTSSAWSEMSGRTAGRPEA